MTAGEVKSSKKLGHHTDSKAYTVKVLFVVREAQLTHGLRHNDYQLYRQYCTRRIHRLRKRLKMTQGTRKNYNKKEVDTSHLKNEDYLYIPLMKLERYWAYAMQLKEESADVPRKKFTMRNKLRKAASYVVDFEKLVEACSSCDARTQLEVKGYSAWLQGTVLFEMAEFTHEWKRPVEFFNKARDIYTKLRSTVAEEEMEAYQHRLQELEVKLRYCRHHLGDKAATDTLLAMGEDNFELGAKLDKLVAIAREKQASTLSEVSWKGRTMSVKHEKIRLFLLNESLLRDQLSQTSKLHDFVNQLDRIIMDAKDAIQITKEDLKNDPSFKTRQVASQGPVSPLHFLHTYLSCLRLQLTVLRNLALHHSYRRILRNEDNKDGKKQPKLHDMVRLCELNTQNLAEILTLSGLEEDEEFKSKLERDTMAYRAHKCFYVAEHLGKLEKWPEALAMYEQAGKLAGQTDKESLEIYLVESLDAIQKEVDSKKYAAQAKMLLSDQNDDLEPESEDLSAVKHKYLVDRLETYFEDEGLLKTPRVAPVPPEMVSIPCKPLFFDLALNHIDFPSLDDKTGESGNQGAVRGIRGLVKGLWGWGS